MKPGSFKLNISLWFVLLAGAILAGGGFLFLSVIRTISYDRVDRELAAVATAEASRPLGPSFTNSLPAYLQAQYGKTSSTHIVIRATDLTDKEVYASPDWPAGLTADQLPPLPPPDEATTQSMRRRPRGVRGSSGQPVSVRGPVFATVHANDQAWRIVTTGNDRAVFLAGRSLSDEEADLRRVQQAFFVATPVLLLLLFSAGWILASRALRPVKAIAQTTAGMTAHRLSERIPSGSAAREFQQLIGVINEMLERLDASFQQSSRFSADAAHELKTPLTVLQGQLDVAIRQAEPGSAEQARCSQLLDEVQRLKQIVQKLLLLARADSGQLTLNTEPVDLSQLLDAAAEDVELLAPYLKINQHIEPGITVAADATLLRQVIGNLTSNAVKYNQPDGRVELELVAEEDRARITVRNTGPAIPPEERIRIFERFYRADKSRSREVDGTGLGLSLAREIVRAHGGDLFLDATAEPLIAFVLILPL
jgi:heavy metal sensor kinase